MYDIDAFCYNIIDSDHEQGHYIHAAIQGVATGVATYVKY